MKTPPPNAQVRHNQETSRFELETDEGLAVADYVRDGSVVRFTHTEVPVALRNRGIGSLLAKGALDSVRKDGLAADPACPFISAFIADNPEYKDLVKP